MAGVMNEECVPFRPLLAERLLLGMPLPDELSRHVDRCPDCAREADEFGDVVRTLRRSDPSVATPSGTGEWPSRELGDRIRRDVAEPEVARPRRGRRIAVGVTAAALVAAAALVVPLVTDQEPRPASTVALERPGPMISHPWGTEVPVALSGLRPGRTYRMMAVNAAGKRLPGGSVRTAAGEPVSTRMVTAMRRDTITALIVEDEEGGTVVHVPVTPRPTN